jgi:hypothetical protein
VEDNLDESSTHVFAGLLVLPISKTTQIDLSYVLPMTILQTLSADQNAYSLRIDVQPGLNGLPFIFEIVLPDSMQATSEGLTMIAGQENTWSWHGVLEKSLNLMLTLSKQH